MIIKDKSIYLNYVQKIKTKVDSLYEQSSAIAGTNPYKQLIEISRNKILATIELVTKLVNQEIGLIPNSDWIKFKKELEDQCNQLSFAVNQAVATKTQANAR